MSDVLDAFYREMPKVAAEREKKRRSPFRALAATAPFVLGNAAAEFPKGVIEEGIETGINRGARAIPRAGRSAIKQGLGRLAGEVGAASVTTPLFLKGIKDIKDGKKRQGTAEVVAAGTAFSAIKGGIEAGAKSKGKAQILKAVKRLGTSRGITGAASAALVANQVGKALKAKKGGKKKTNREKYLGPAAAGMVAGAGKGGFDVAWKHKTKGTLKHLRTAKGMKAVGAKALGRSVGGIIGATVMTALAGKALNSGKTKKASESPRPLFNPSERYLISRTASSSDPRAGYAAYKASMQAPENPSSRSTRIGTYEGLVSSGVKGLPSPTRKKHTGLSTVDVHGPALLLAGALPMAMTALLEDPSTLDDFMSKAEVLVPEGVQIQRGKQSAFWPEAKKVTLAPQASAATAAHELGHARAGFLRRSTLQSIGARRAGHLGLLASTGASVVTLASFFDSGFKTSDELERDARRLSFVGKASLLAATPLLIEEGLASADAARMLGRTKTMTSRSALQLVAQYGTYVAPFAVALMGARHLRSKAAELRKGKSDEC